MRVLLTRIPLVGDSLTELAAGKGQQIMEARRDEFLQLLAEHLAALEEQAVRKDFFQTPEGFDLLIKALDESRRTRSKEERPLREDIAGAIVDFEQKRYSAEEYLYLISDLTFKELRVARLLYETRPGSQKGYWEEWKNEVCGDLNIDRDDLSMVLARIEASGLKERVIGTKGSKRYIGSTNPGMGYYKVTPAFKKLMNFVELES